MRARLPRVTPAPRDRAKLRPAVAALMSDYSRRPIGEWSIGEAFAQLVTATRGQNFAVPLHLLVLARALVLVEATVRRAQLLTHGGLHQVPEEKPPPLRLEPKPPRPDCPLRTGTPLVRLCSTMRR